jgi:hypothetical protein
VRLAQGKLAIVRASRIPVNLALSAVVGQFELNSFSRIELGLKHRNAPVDFV